MKRTLALAKAAMRYWSRGCIPGLTPPPLIARGRSAAGERGSVERLGIYTGDSALPGIRQAWSRIA